MIFFRKVEKEEGRGGWKQVLKHLKSYYSLLYKCLFNGWIIHVRLTWLLHGANTTLLCCFLCTPVFSFPPFAAEREKKNNNISAFPLISPLTRLLISLARPIPFPSHTKKKKKKNPPHFYWRYRQTVQKVICRAANYLQDVECGRVAVGRFPLCWGSEFWDKKPVYFGKVGLLGSCETFQKVLRSCLMICRTWQKCD